MVMLNDKQQEAVNSARGRVLVLAGAGSGKTRVLISRIIHLINHHKVAPENILGLTFTNKAAGEMRERIARELSPKVSSKVHLLTFHSFCYQILRKEIHRLGYTNSFSLYDEKDIKRLVENLTRQKLDHDAVELPSIQSTIEHLHALKMNPDHFTTPKAKKNRLVKGAKSEETEETQTWHASFVKELSSELKSSLKAYNAVDFDGLLTLTIDLLEQFPDLLEKYQKVYQYIMIDEYQDTNHTQLRLAELLAAKHDNLCVVGDDDQSIYGWRGSDVKNILNFQHHTIVKLEQNYRSTHQILEAANKVILNNNERHDKQLWTTTKQGDKLHIVAAPTEKEEARAIAEQIVYLKLEKGLAWSDIAILYRSNTLSRTFEMALLEAHWQEGGLFRRGIPYQIIAGTEFLERAEIKDLLAYLRVIANPQDQEALLRIINYPRRGISSKTLEIVTQYNRENDVILYEVLDGIASCRREYHDLIAQLTSTAQKGIVSFIDMMSEAKHRFASRGLHASLEWLIEEMNYVETVKNEVKSEKGKQFKGENIQAVADMVKEYEIATPDGTIEGFVTESLLDQQRTSMNKASKKTEGVNLLTFHSSKGLEFKACFLVAIEDHIIPHEKSLQETGVEEERRLFYVALTRAQKYLTLSMSKKRMRMGKEVITNPSRFLFEIPQEFIQPCSYRKVEPFLY